MKSGYAIKEFGRELRKRRRFFKQSQAKLAARAGTTQATIAHIEAGRVNPTVQTLEDLASGLGQELVIRFRPRISKRP